MYRKIIILSVLLLPSVKMLSQEGSRLFISPLSDQVALSASFAELRNDHFHSGLDYKTGGVTGKEVMAAGDGYVYRIGVSPTGFGKVLYVRHPSGFSTVYGHLERFRPDIAEFVRNEQYAKKSFSVTLYPARNQFRVTRGEVIAWSGNSGSSSGPHLHFEVRDSGTEDPLNPLEFVPGISDHVRPVIEKVLIYPLTPSSTVNGSNGRLTLRPVSGGSSTRLSIADPPEVNGMIGFGIKTWDSFDNSANKCGIYTITLTVDSVNTFLYRADRFSYSESRYINSHVDYRAKVTDGEYIHKMFLQPGNRLGMYEIKLSRGIVTFTDDRLHHITLTVTDKAGNRSEVSFAVRSVPTTSFIPVAMECNKVIPWGKASDFSAEGIRVHFPPLSLYDTLFLRYSSRPGTRFLSRIHSVHDRTVAVHDPVRISVQPDTILPGKEGKLCLAVVDAAGRASYAGGEYKYGFVSADVRSFGDYAVTADTVAPAIKLSFTKGADLTGRKSFSAVITDEFSGIASYNMNIDGTWVLAEYDAKNNLLVCYLSEAPVKKNTLHKIEVDVTDNRGNIKRVKSEFRW